MSCYVTSDADVRVEKDYLLRMVQNLKDPKLGLASCVYLGTAYGGTMAGGALRRSWTRWARAWR